MAMFRNESGPPMPDRTEVPLVVGCVLLLLYAVSHIVSNPGIPIPLETIAQWASIVGVLILTAYVIDTGLIRKATQESLRRNQTPLLRFTFEEYEFADFNTRVVLFLRVQNPSTNVAIIRLKVDYFSHGRHSSTTGVYDNQSNYVLWPGDDISGPIDVTEAWASSDRPSILKGLRDLDVLVQAAVYGVKREKLYVHRREWRCSIDLKTLPPYRRQDFAALYPHTVSQHPDAFMEFEDRVDCRDVEGLENLP